MCGRILTVRLRLWQRRRRRRPEPADSTERARAISLHRLGLALARMGQLPGVWVYTSGAEDGEVKRVLSVPIVASLWGGAGRSPIGDRNK